MGAFPGLHGGDGGRGTGGRCGGVAGKGISGAAEQSRTGGIEQGLT